MARFVEDRQKRVHGAANRQIPAREQGILPAASDVQAGERHKAVRSHGARFGRCVAPAQLPWARRRLKRVHHLRRKLAFEILGRFFVAAAELLPLRFLCVARWAHQENVAAAAAVCHGRVVVDFPAVQQVAALGAAPFLLFF